MLGDFFYEVYMYVWWYIPWRHCWSCWRHQHGRFLSLVGDWTSRWIGKPGEINLALYWGQNLIWKGNNLKGKRIWFVTFTLPSHIVAVFAKRSILFAYFFHHMSRMINLKSQNNIVLPSNSKQFWKQLHF